MDRMVFNIKGKRVLADKSYGKLGKCKKCGVIANLSKGLCEWCFMTKFNPHIRF